MKTAFITKVLLLTLLATTLLPLFTAHKASAITGGDWNAGRIIDDQLFFNPSLMSANDIQAFLNAKVPSCDTSGAQSKSYYYNSTTGEVEAGSFNGATYVTTNRATYGQRYDAFNNTNYASAPYVCLKDYSQNTPARAGETNLCMPYAGGNNQSAAQIINDVSKACGLSPEVLLVLLQKEQSLVTDDWPWDKQFDRATGFACPDTPQGCDPAYSGFFYQVYNAARQFKKYQRDAGNYGYRAGRNNNIYYQADNPSTTNVNENQACGSSNVYIANQATAGLYVYTPYQPNQAALNNLYGSGDGCSAYGNRNFWRLFNDWFGIPLSNARVYVTQYNATTDNTGGAAWFGFSLSQQPTNNVTIPLRFSPNAPAEFASQATVTITPQTWNRPDLNRVVIRGSTSSSGSQYYTLMTDGVQTADGNFSILTAGYTPDITVTQQDTAATPVYRLYNSTTGQHLYTAVASERSAQLANGLSDEGTAFYSCRGGETTVYRLNKDQSTFLVSAATNELQTALSQGYVLDAPAFSTSRGAFVPVYRMYNSTTGDHLFTTSTSEYAAAVNSGYAQEGPGFAACSANQQPVYRMYNPATNDHFYTASPQERDSAGGSGYVHEGVGFYLCPTAQNVSIYRLYESRSGHHFYTSSLTEQQQLIASGGFVSEGVPFSTCNTTSQPIYRLYNQANGDHFFTPSLIESRQAAGAGYTNESVNFYSTP